MKESLIEVLQLEKLGENAFCGRSQDFGLNRIFGGQVLGQALAAAGRTVEGRAARSFHAYFLLFASDKMPIRYEVDRILDSPSSSIRRVVAVQEDRILFTLSASFHVEEKGLEHQIVMPATLGPENMPTMPETLSRMAERNSRLLSFFHRFPIEIRPVQPVDPYASGTCLPFMSLWLRASSKLPDEKELHQAALAYVSDYGLITTAGLPHGIHFRMEKFDQASLDHAIWYHRDFRMDEWLLYLSSSPSASNSRGFTRGSFFSRDGKLVASVAQEVLIRQRPGLS